MHGCCQLVESFVWLIPFLCVKRREKMKEKREDESEEREDEKEDQEIQKRSR